MDTYSSFSGHNFTSSPISPVVVYTQDDVEPFSHGQEITDQDGQKFTVVWIKYVAGRLYRIELLPHA